MGISRLNYFLQTACPHGIHKISLTDLYGKIITIDISIYLYKFKEQNDIIGNLYMMCSIFKQLNIKPIFVFDGPPPPEKMAIIECRKKRKQQAEKKYNILKAKLKDSLPKNKNIIQDMQKLKNKFIRIKNWEIRQVKKFFQSYGISYIEASGEADKWCAKLVLENKAYACLSEDMDLFAYGCPRVLRYLNLFKKTVVIYDLNEILNILEIDVVNFRKICILSGTDY